MGSGFEFTAILLSPYLECWDYKHAWPHLLDRLISDEGPEILSPGLMGEEPYGWEEVELRAAGYELWECWVHFVILGRLETR